MEAPTVKLNNGIEMPKIGLGTFMARDTRTAIKMAIKLGYRMIDTSPMYINEHIIGQALKERVSDGTVKREDLFIVSKLWNTHHEPEKVLPALQNTLKNLQLNYLDLYIIHWPFGFKGEDYALLGAQDETPLEDTWKAMEECVKRGYTKSIGLSNFNESQIERIINIAEIKPVVNQVECHLFFNQKEMIKFGKEHDIVIMAYMPLFAPKRNVHENILTNDIVNDLASKYGKTNSQIALRYLVQRDVVPIPKSEKPMRIKQNFAVFNFTLSDEDMELLDGLNTDRRISHYLGATEFKEYPFEVKFQ